MPRITITVEAEDIQTVDAAVAAAAAAAAATTSTPNDGPRRENYRTADMYEEEKAAHKLDALFLDPNKKRDSKSVTLKINRQAV